MEGVLLHGSTTRMPSWSMALANYKFQRPVSKTGLHGFLEDWTLHDNVPERSRHRMVANSWHVGVARFLMMLLFGTTLPVEGITVEIPAAPRQSTLQWMIALATRHPAHMGPGQWNISPTSHHPRGVRTLGSITVCLTSSPPRPSAGPRSSTSL